MAVLFFIFFGLRFIFIFDENFKGYNDISSFTIGGWSSFIIFLDFLLKIEYLQSSLFSFV